MRILIDTNILIPMEDSSVELNEQLAQLSRLASGKHQILFHPASKIDIDRDKDQLRKKSILTRLAKYLELEEPPIFGSNEEEILFGRPKKDNDKVDNLILLALHKNCVHWLITHDQGIHKKAQKIFEAERVFDVAQAILALSEIEAETISLHPSIKKVPCHSIDIKDQLFDSLREGYPQFDSWFNEKCCKEGRHAWICKEGNKIDAICIYKTDKNPIITHTNKALKGKCLKLCTFKVDKKGFKIGELFLKQAFNYAIDNGIEYIYLTVTPKKQLELEHLLLDFGFSSYGTDTKGIDEVYVKTMPTSPPQTDDSPLDYLIKYYPAMKLDKNKGFLVPILPQYHKILFPELEIQKDFFSGTENSAGNSIKQAYICSSPTKTVEPGDILFFYRTKDQKAITTYGIVDQFIVAHESDKIYQWVAKRTVYTYDEISKMNGNSKKIILFRLIRHLESDISFTQLKKLNIVNGNIQSITSLSREKVIKLIEEAKINDCLISN